MPKIISDNGVELYFEDYDVLKNGDIYVHGVSKTNNVVQFPKKEGTPVKAVTATPIQSIPGPKYEPSKPLVRVARPPVKELRIGLMCPTCHQSKILNMPNDIVSIATHKSPTDFIVTSTDDFKKVETHNVNSKSDLIKYLAESDQYILNTLESANQLDITKLLDNYSSSDEAECPLCNSNHKIQDWVNEYANPTTEFFNSCTICGSEMSMITETVNEKEVPIWCCDNTECNYKKE